MLNPEYYIEEYKSSDGAWNTTRFSDEINAAISNHTDTKLGERRPFIITPVPGESPWISSAEQQNAEASINHLKLDSTTSTAKKRSYPNSHQNTTEEMSISMLVSDDTEDMKSDDADSLITSNTKSMLRSAMSSQHADESPHSFPSSLAPQAGSCMVYVYAPDDSGAPIKLNDIIDIVGVFSTIPDLALQPLPSSSAGDAATDDHLMTSMLDDEGMATHMPTSLVPRIHAILIRKESSPYAVYDMTSSYTNKNLPGDQTTGDHEKTISTDQLRLSRGRALGFLSMVLGGDDLTAEYLLLQTISRVHARGKESGTMSLGTIPLNIINCPSPDAPLTTVTQQPATTTTTAGMGGDGLSPLGEAVAAALSVLAPRCVALPLTLERLNTAPWWPRRDNQGGVRLITGPLQVAAATQLVLDETVLDPGTISETGLRNLAAVQGIMQRQQLSYEFEFFGLDQPMDAPVTVLSTGRTMLKGTGEVIVPLMPTAPMASRAGDIIDAASGSSMDADSVRRYIAAVRAMEFSIPDDVASKVQEDLAVAKQKDAMNVNADTFHVWLNVARLLALSHGEKVLTEMRWEQALALEKKRKDRLGMISKEK